MTPLITVITITFNDLNGFVRTAASVIPQLSSSVEWIIKDGGSSPFILQEIKRVVLSANCTLVSSRDHGVYDAMNQALSIANGDWLIFMNGGDVFNSVDTISQILETIQAYKLEPSNSIILGGGTELISESGRTSYQHARSLSQCSGINCYRMASFHQSQFISRSVYLGQRFRDDLPVSADHAFFWQAIMDGAVFIPLEIPVSRFYLGGLSSKKKFRSSLDVGYSIFKIQRQDNLLGLLAFFKRLLASYLPRSRF